MISKKKIKPWLDILTSFGVEDLEVDNSRCGHIKIYGTVNGRRRSFHAPNTPSDYRNILNWKTDIKRCLSDSQGRPDPARPPSPAPSASNAGRSGSH